MLQKPVDIRRRQETNLDTNGTPWCPQFKWKCGTIGLPPCILMFLEFNKELCGKQVQGDLDQLKQEVAELRLRLSPVADMRERHAMVCDPKVTSDIRSDETQTCASRRVSATVTGINPITVQTNNDERRPVEETRVSQRQVAENFGIADSIATLEQRLALLESRKSGEVPGGPESKEVRSPNFQGRNGYSTSYNRAFQGGGLDRVLLHYPVATGL